MSQSKPLLSGEEVQMTDYHDPFSDPRRPLGKQKQKFFIHYETIFWIVFGVLTAYCILDRFFINLFPMSINFKPLAGPCYMFGVPCVNSMQSRGMFVHWSITIFDGYGRATGRLFLTVFGALFWTQCKSTENVLMEHHPSWVDLGDLRTVHNRTHYILGMFFMAIPMYFHLMLTFLPAAAGVPYTLGPFRPPNKVTPFIIANAQTGQAEMFLTFDDIYRIVSSMFLFAILFPFSISNAARKRWFSPTQWLHIAGAVMFGVDMIRRSPHAQVFNVPVVFYWVCDRLIGLWFYRTGIASVIHKEILDDEYLILFLYVPRQKKRRQTGSGYYLSLAGLEGLFEISHPFITIQNHTGDPIIPEWLNRDASASVHKFYIDRSAGERKAFARRPTLTKKHEDLLAEEDEMDRKLENEDGIAAQTDDVVFFSNWNTAVFIQIHKWNRGENSFTAKIATKNVGARVRFWGPYTSEYCQITPDGHYLPPLVLIGTGAGAGPIMDFYMYFTANKMELVNPATAYFSTNSIGLFQFFTDLTCSKAILNWSVNAHLTKRESYELDFEQESAKGTHDTHSSTRDMKLGRLSFTEVLAGAPSDSQVFFCGAPALQWKVQIAAHQYKLRYFPGHRFASDGARECQRTGTCRFTCMCNRFPCCLVY